MQTVSSNPTIQSSGSVGRKVKANRKRQKNQKQRERAELKADERRSKIAAQWAWKHHSTTLFRMATGVLRTSDDHACWDAAVNAIVRWSREYASKRGRFGCTREAALFRTVHYRALDECRRIARWNSRFVALEDVDGEHVPVAESSQTPAEAAESRERCQFLRRIALDLPLPMLQAAVLNLLIEAGRPLTQGELRERLEAKGIYTTEKAVDTARRWVRRKYQERLKHSGEEGEEFLRRIDRSARERNKADSNKNNKPRKP